MGGLGRAPVSEGLRKRLVYASSPRRVCGEKLVPHFTDEN